MSYSHEIEDFLGYGWFPAESDGVKKWAWSKEIALLNLPPRHKGLSLEISGCPVKASSLIIKHDNNEIHASVLKGPPMTVNIPTGVLSCLIKLTGSWIPNEILGTADVRELGICLHSINPIRGYSEVCEYFPLEIEMGLSGKCNINPPCVMCHTRHHKYNNEQKYLPKDIIDKLNPYFAYAQSIALHGTEGEPLLFPELFNIIGAIDKQGASCGFATNGLLLTKEMGSKLISAGLKQIEFSIDAATSDTYSKIRNNNGFYLLLSNIRQLVMLKKSQGISFPDIVLTMVVMKENMLELPGFIELAYDLGVSKVNIRLLVPIENNYEVNDGTFRFNYYEQKVNPESDEFKSVLAIFKEKAKKYNINISSDNPEINTLLHEDIAWFEPPREPNQITVSLFGNVDRDIFLFLNQGIQCKFPWKHILVDLNGDVRFCCHTKQKLGNLHINNFVQIWNGEVAKNIRTAFLENKWPIGCLACPIRRLQGDIWSSNIATKIGC